MKCIPEIRLQAPLLQKQRHLPTPTLILQGSYPTQTVRNLASIVDTARFGAVLKADFSGSVINKRLFEYDIKIIVYLV